MNKIEKIVNLNLTDFPNKTEIPEEETTFLGSPNLEETLLPKNLNQKINDEKTKENKE